MIPESVWSLREQVLSLLWWVTFPGSLFGPIGSIVQVAFESGVVLGGLVH